MLMERVLKLDIFAKGIGALANTMPRISYQ
jgi:hypothetical protein